MAKVKLNELANIYLGVTHTPEYVFEGVPFLSVKDISGGKICFDDCKYISKEEYDSLSEGAKPKVGDMMFCRVGTLGKPIIIPEGTPLFGTFVSLGYLRNRNSDRCDLNYLKYWMYSNSFWKQVNANVKGASQVNLNTGWLSKFDIDLPGIAEQRYRISVLDKCKSVIEKREAELAALDNLIKARFVEMFGDPIQNPKGWEVVTIGDIVTEVRYGTSKPAVEGGKYPYLRMNNLTADGHLDLNDLKYIDIPDDEIEKCVVRKGDVLFNRTNSIELVGKTAVFDLPEDMIIAGYIIRVRLTEKMLPEVLSQYMNLEALKGILRGMAKGAVNQANINAQELQSIKVYIPEMELQKQFVKMKEQIYKSKVAVQKALDETQMLFDSLMQEYFR